MIIHNFGGILPGLDMEKENRHSNLLESAEIECVKKIITGKLNGHPEGWDKGGFMESIAGSLMITKRTMLNVLERLGPTGAGMFKNEQHHASKTVYLRLDKAWTVEDLESFVKNPPRSF